MVYSTHFSKSAEKSVLNHSFFHSCKYAMSLEDGCGLHLSLVTSEGIIIESPIIMASPSFKVDKESVTGPIRSGGVIFSHNSGPLD